MSSWSISDLFDEGGEAGEVNEAPFDPSAFDAVLDKVMADRPVAGRPPEMQGEVIPEPEPAPVPEPEPAPEPETPPVPEAPAPAPSDIPPPAAPADLFANLDPLERQELALLREALRDPDRQVAIRRAYLGVADPTAAVTEAPPGTPPSPVASAPTLPEHIDPDSFEAQLWHAQQETNRQLSELRAGLAQQNQATEEQNAAVAAQRATQAFVAKYGDRLERTDVEWVAQTAGMQGLPAAFVSTGMPLEEAMTRSLEFTLRSNDELLAKVLGGGPHEEPPPAPSPGPTAQETDLRKRQLSALSSAATPAGEAPVAPVIQHREDGKLTEQSRLDLIRQMTGGGVMGELMGPS